MKRASSDMSLSPEHPAVAFHREVLIVQQWSLIRKAFLDQLEATATHGVEWHEPRKLWRHSQEALGKWILSQIARVKGAAGGADGSFGSSLSFDEYMASLHFFPTARDFRQFAPSGRAYDEQLIRDLSIKSRDGASDEAVVLRLKTLVAEFDLAGRCDAAHAAVEAQLAEALAYAEGNSSNGSGSGGTTMRSLLAQPRLRRLEDGDPARTASQKRVHGAIAELSVQWPRHLDRQQTRNCPPVSIPWPAFLKLKRSYEHYNSKSNKSAGARVTTINGPNSDEEARAANPTTASSGDNNHSIPLTAEESFLYRAAVVALRYEGGLATGSLQLCADTSLKQHLHARGYHVMDLCASPINAYMGLPETARFLGGGGGGEDSSNSNRKTNYQGSVSADGRQSSLDLEQERPNLFCSAFLDTDRYFGSMGSALRVDPLALHRSPYVNPGGQPLLLTLDVPYDEDLCEMLFQKLIVDMGRAAKEDGSVQVDYVLVLPLWWSVPMRIDKHLLSDETRVGGGGSSNPTTATSNGSSNGVSKEEQTAAVLKVVEERSAMLKEGYQVPYTWPEDLAAASGDATAAAMNANQPQQPWVCFDGLFVGNSGYAYFCTATNRWLQGVTATEVIGLAQPRAAEGARDGGGLLGSALGEYYL